MLKDAFNPEEETERDWDLELRDDVKGECEAKYGKVGEIFVVKESQVRSFSRLLAPKGEGHADPARAPPPSRERFTFGSKRSRLLLRPWRD